MWILADRRNPPGRHRKPPSRRSRAAFIAAALLILSSVPGSIAEASQPSPPGPSLQQVNAAIDLAQAYLDGLYKPLPDGQAVQSEDYGLPLRVYFPGYDRWELLGQGHAGDCLPKCSGASSITPGSSDTTTETFTVSFATPSTPDALRIAVALDWAAAPGRFSVTVSDPQMTDTQTSAELWLDDVPLGTYSSGSSTAPVVRSFPTADRSLLRSLRYTVRHATQEAYLYGVLRGDSVRAGRLAAFLRANDFAPGVDLRATIFGAGQQLPGDLPFVSSGPDNVYADCDHLPAAGTTAYPYTSKICLLGVDTFLLAGRGDPFLQTTQALQTLTKYRDPQHEYPVLISLGLQGGTPTETADHLEQLWTKLGYGLPACTPLGCESGRASGLRTFVFGSLEATLGYQYGQVSRQRYADAVAADAIAVQVGSSGTIKAADGTWVRPMQRGGFPVYWDAGHRFVPTTGLVQSLNDMLSMPPEYAGAVVSDSETTFDGFAFLVTYRCARFAVGCTDIG
ncbi:hypothetical protein [Arthrobacter sp. FW306-04-A]|uniref:hypothetical protein n=1 Tax=Arthrobacter sp. FW306-04-A TaxID=2879619 RepID=UPI0037BED809|nr:hypothetical protein LFT43_16490 [Arthrobacter sp. FW306-04-A]